MKSATQFLRFSLVALLIGWPISMHAQWVQCPSGGSNACLTGNVSIGTTSPSGWPLYILSPNSPTGVSLYLNTPSSGQQSTMQFASGGAGKWQVGMNGDTSYFVWETTGTASGQSDFIIYPSTNGSGTGNGTMALMPNGGSVDINAQLSVEQRDFGGTHGIYIIGGNTTSNYPNLGFGMVNASNAVVQAGTFQGQIMNNTTGSESIDLTFQTTTSGSAGLAERMRITGAGKVGIGTWDPCSNSGAPANCLLGVHGGIQANEVVVNTGWSDYVFDPAYRLTPLREVADYIQTHHHLPDVPSAADVASKGVNLGETEATLLAKIEELTLHMIEAEKRADRMEHQNAELQRQVVELQQGRGRTSPGARR